MSETLMCCPLCGASFKMGREPDDNGYVAGMFYLFHTTGPKDCRLGMGGHFDTEAQAVTAWNTRSEGLQPPVVEVDEKVFSSLGASRAPSCGSPTVPETPSGGWQDIASAPKDGTRFLAIAVLGMTEPEIMHWHVKLGWATDDALYRDPEVWRPLPATAKRRGGGGEA